jgi:hypothetical protein
LLLERSIKEGRRAGFDALEDDMIAARSVELERSAMSGR